MLMSVDAYSARFPGDPRRAFALEEMPDNHLRMVENTGANAAKAQ